MTQQSTKKPASLGKRTASKLVFSLAAAIFMVGISPSTASADAGGGETVSIGVGRWAVMADTSLKSTLEAWSRAAGWTVIWDNPYDYRLRASATFGGGFEEAVGRLIDSIYQENPEITATLYRGNRVLHVEQQINVSQ